MDWEWAKAKLEDGYFMRRKSWAEGALWRIDDDGALVEYLNGAENILDIENLHADDTSATDWELAE